MGGATPSGSPAPHRVHSPSGCRQTQLRIDLGCGAGRYISDIGRPVVGIERGALDARAMPCCRP